MKPKSYIFVCFGFLKVYRSCLVDVGWIVDGTRLLLGESCWCWVLLDAYQLDRWCCLVDIGWVLGVAW